LTVGFYAPLPPARTGVADYAAALLEGLRAHGRVEIAPARCDAALYHLGNNRLHAEIYRRALDCPGAIVLHDAVLHHFLLGELGESGYIDEFAYNYGEWNRSLARDLWLARGASGADYRYFEFPMLRRTVERARAVIVHNPGAARIAREHGAGRVEIIPHLFADPPLVSEAEVVRYRQRLGIPADFFLFGVFGYLRESKRLMAVLEAFARVRDACPRAGLLVAGSFVSTDLARAAEPLLRAPGVWRLPHLPERDFWRAAQAVDACINLRYPGAGETSGIAIRLMGIGKPVLLTESPEAAEFPEDACIRIPPGPPERDALRQHMILLTLSNGVAGEVGRRGAGFIRAHHRVNSVSEQYWQVLCDICT
jgi:glycosyltransferase involved in cell wall biosynthesis